MPKREQTDFIVIHCSATRADQDIGAVDINQWHKRRGWTQIGYHAVIRRDGTIEFGRHFDQIGAHVKGYNARSVGVCLVGGIDDSGKAEDNFTLQQFRSLDSLIAFLYLVYTGAKVVGHRDLSPDLDGDGVISESEWMKECPCFDAQARYP